MKIEINSPQDAIYYLMLVEAGIDPMADTLCDDITSIDELWDYYSDDPAYECTLGDIECEFREGMVRTDIPAPHDRHYESESVAYGPLPDGRWVGWTYWYGGGKWADPDSIDWIPHAYFLTVKEEERIIIHRTFTKEEE